MHSLMQYLWMVGDAVRVEAYGEAIRAVVRPGDRVVDLGAGFGYFSVVAARAGASRVDAIEISPVVHLGPRIAEANGCAAVIRFHPRDSADVVLPDRADVLIADLRRQTPFSRQSIATIIDARARLLTAGGRLIAAVDHLMVAPSATPRALRHDWQALERSDPIDLAAVERIVRDTPHPYHVEVEALHAAGVEWGTIDYASVTDAGRSGEAAWPFERSVAVDGLTVWFESDLAPGVRLSSAPGAPGHTYGQLFLPFRAPVAVGPGERLRVRVGATPGGADYVWHWEAEVEGPTGLRHACAQNSLAETALDPAALAAVNATPRSNS